MKADDGFPNLLKGFTHESNPDNYNSKISLSKCVYQKLLAIKVPGFQP